MYENDVCKHMYTMQYKNNSKADVPKNVLVLYINPMSWGDYGRLRAHSCGYLHCVVMMVVDIT